MNFLFSLKVMNIKRYSSLGYKPIVSACMGLQVNSIKIRHQVQVGFDEPIELKRVFLYLAHWLIELAQVYVYLIFILLLMKLYICLHIFAIH